MSPHEDDGQRTVHFFIMMDVQNQMRMWVDGVVISASPHPPSKYWSYETKAIVSSHIDARLIFYRNSRVPVLTIVKGGKNTEQKVKIWHT